jgi:hypothetical protein
MGRATKGQLEAVFCLKREDRREGGVLQAGQTATPVCTFTHSFGTIMVRGSHDAPRVCPSPSACHALAKLVVVRVSVVHGSCANGGCACTVPVQKGVALAGMVVILGGDWARGLRFTWCARTVEPDSERVGLAAHWQGDSNGKLH